MEDFPELPDHAVYVGREGALEIDRHFREMWGEFAQEPVEFIDGATMLSWRLSRCAGKARAAGLRSTPKRSGSMS
jgi:hypothetical protein